MNYRSPISIVIPTLNSQHHLPRCLEALTPGLVNGLIREVLIVDGGSNDRTLEIAGASGCRIIACRKGRGPQLRTGGKNARGDWLLFLHADTALNQNWAHALASRIQENDRFRACAFTLAYDSEHPDARWLEKRAALRCKLLGLPYGDQALFLHSNFYNELGGFDDVPLMEDVAIVRRIGKKRMNILPEQAVTASDKYERDGWKKRAWRNAFLLTRYFLGASPEKLAADYD